MLEFYSVCFSVWIIHCGSLCRSLDSPSTSAEALSDAHHMASNLTALQDDSDVEVEPELPPLEASIPKEALKKLRKSEKKRQDVINGKLSVIWCSCSSEKCKFFLYWLLNIAWLYGPGSLKMYWGKMCSVVISHHWRLTV